MFIINACNSMTGSPCHSHEYETLTSLTWLCSCQQYPVTQDFFYSLLIFLLITPKKVHWFTKLGFATVITLICNEFPIHGEQSWFLCVCVSSGTKIVFQFTWVEGEREMKLALKLLRIYFLVLMELGEYYSSLTEFQVS